MPPHQAPIPESLFCPWCNHGTSALELERSSLWIGISLPAWVLAGLGGTALRLLNPRPGAVLFWLGFFFAGTVLSTVGMIWLLASQGQEAGPPPA